MNKNIFELIGKKGQRLIKMRYMNYQVLTKKSKFFFCIIIQEGMHEIYYILKKIKKEKYLMNKSYKMKSVLDHSTLKIKEYSPFIIFLTKI